MPLFLVVRPSNGLVPPQDQITDARVYLTNQGTEDAAVEAAVSAFNLPSGTSCWVTSGASLTKYLTSITAAPG